MVTSVLVMEKNQDFFSFSFFVFSSRNDIQLSFFFLPLFPEYYSLNGAWHSLFFFFFFFSSISLGYCPFLRGSSRPLPLGPRSLAVEIFGIFLCTTACFSDLPSFLPGHILQPLVLQQAEPASLGGFGEAPEEAVG